MTKRRRKRTLSKTNNAKATQLIQEIKTEEEKKQEVADELCNRMLGKEEKNSEKTKENLIEENTITEETKDENILDINEESYEVPQETIITTKYIPDEMNDIEIFSGIVELVNKIYSSNEMSKEEFDIASETYDNAKEIYTDAAFNFPSGIKVALCKGLEILDKNKFTISTILTIVKEILSMEKAMLKCKVNVKDEGIKVDVNVEDVGQEKTKEENKDTKDEENKKEEKTKDETEVEKKKEFKDPFEGMDNPSLRLLRLICGITK